MLVMCLTVLTLSFGNLKNILLENVLWVPCVCLSVVWSFGNCTERRFGGNKGLTRHALIIIAFYSSVKLYLAKKFLRINVSNFSCTNFPVYYGNWNVLIVLAVGAAVKSMCKSPHDS